jgi:hypothetical protein
MKKFLSILISTVICLMFSVTAYAAGFGGNYVISTTDKVTVSDGMKISNEIDAFAEETGVTPCIVFLEKLTQGSLPAEAEYYYNNYYDYENTFILIYNVNSGKVFIDAFGKYAERIGEKAGVFELGEKMTEEQAFKDSYQEGASAYLDYVQMMIDAYGEDEFTQGVHNATDIIGLIISIGKWFIGPIIGAILVMNFYKSIVRRQYRNLEKASMSSFESKQDTIFYHSTEEFVREYVHTHD